MKKDIRRYKLGELLEIKSKLSRPNIQTIDAFISDMNVEGFCIQTIIKDEMDEMEEEYDETDDVE